MQRCWCLLIRFSLRSWLPWSSGVQLAKRANTQGENSGSTPGTHGSWTWWSIASRAKNQGKTRRCASIGRPWRRVAFRGRKHCWLSWHGWRDPIDDQPLKLFFVHLEMVLLTSPGAKKGNEDFHICQEYDFTSSKSCKHLGKHCHVVQNWRQSNTPDKARTG